MAYEHSIRRFRSWYATLLRLYPKPYRERFGEPMEQTFNDLLRERAEEEKGLFGFALWMFVETFAGLIRENITVIIMQNKSIIRIALATAFILLLPLLAMQFTDEVVWDLADFAVAGVLLFGAGLTYELIARKAGHIAYRAAVGVAVAAALLLVWMNLAVGIMGNEGNPANLMYTGVLAVGIIGLSGRQTKTTLAEYLCVWHMNTQYDDSETGTQHCFVSTRSDTASALENRWSRPSTTFSESAQRKKKDYSASLSGCSSKHSQELLERT